MRRSWGVVVLVGACSLAAGFGLGAALGQQGPPTENKGLDARVESTIDLGPAVSGYQRRLRAVTFERGGEAGVHGHQERAVFADILSRHATGLREGGVANALGPGGLIGG